MMQRPRGADAQNMFRTGRDGLLCLLLRQAHGRTVVAEQRTEPPLAMQRALYCEYSLPDMAYLYIASTSGGILQGDRQVISIKSEGASKAHITTQGATRVYGTDAQVGRGASQLHKIALAHDSYLEYIPDQIIPYAGSRFTQDTEISMHGTSTLVYAETVAPGRVGMGESFAYESCRLRIRIADDQKRLRYADAAVMDPSRAGMNSFGVMGGYGIVSSVYILTDCRIVPVLYDDIHQALRPPAGAGAQSSKQEAAVIGGATLLGCGAGILVRLLGADSESVKRAVDGVVRQARRHVLGAPFTKVRKS